MSIPAWLILAAVACSGAYAWHDSRSREELAVQIKRTQEDLTNLKQRSESLEDELSERKARAERRAARSAPAQVSTTGDSGEEQKIERLRQEVEKAEDESKSLRKSMLAAVDSMRRAASYSPPKDIALQDGKMLKGCRILEVSDGSISVEHSEGLQRLTIANAPAEWVDRFALAWTAPAPAPAPPAASSAVPPAASTAAPSAPEILPALPATAAVVPPVERVSGEALASLDSAISQKRDALASWLKRYASAWNAADYYSQQASNAAWKHYVARYRGKISAHTAVAQENITRAREARVVAQEALIRIGRLRSELSELIERRNSLSR